MDILQWLNTSLQVAAAGFFALLPGMAFWLTVLGFYLLIQRIGQGYRARTLKGKPWSTRHSRQMSQGKG